MTNEKEKSKFSIKSITHTSFSLVVSQRSLDILVIIQALKVDLASQNPFYTSSQLTFDEFAD